MGKAKRKSNQPTESVTPLLTPLMALQELLTQFRNQGVIIGGIAASLLGTPRYTADLDAVFLISLDKLPELLQAAADQGIHPRINDPIGFAQKNRVLLLRHSDSSVDIDLSLGMLPFEYEMVERSTLHSFGNIQLRLPTPEDLIIMKAVAHRPKDLADIQAVAASHPDLDRERIRFWVQQFAEALDLSELWNTVSKFL